MKFRLLGARFLFLLALCGVLAGTGRAQSVLLSQTPQVAAVDPDTFLLCDPDIIDTTFTFANLPAGQQTVSLHLQNAGSKPCRLEGQLGPSFAVDSHGMDVPLCWLCDHDNKPLSLELRNADRILLAPEGRATVDLHWDSIGTSCQWADWAAIFAQWSKLQQYLFIPSGWPMHICSPVRSSGYHAELNPTAIETTEAPLHVSILQKPIYDDERPTLRVELTHAATSSVRQIGCAELYTVRQGRLDPLPVQGSKNILSFTPEQTQEDQERVWPEWKTDRLRRCDIAAGTATADAEIPAADLANVTHIEWRTATLPGEQPAFLIAATHFTVLDADTLAPNWGELVQGVRAGLSVDRTTFTAGERVPVHLRWEDISSTKLLGREECGEPKPVLEIQDEKHNVLRTIPIMSMCGGHGWGPFKIERNEPQRIFRDLSTTHESYNHPLLGVGVFYLVSVWSPRILEGASNDADPKKMSSKANRGFLGGIYATARSLPIRIEVLPTPVP